MNWKRKVYFNFIIIGFAIFFFLPTVGYAVEFSITDVKIDAYLQENGQVHVQESHTYSFEGEFNGITREIVAKEGTKISNFKATENGNELRTETEDDLYKIHRKGEDESITVKLSYTIANGVDVYSDVAEFYWPFFDERNESTYEQMTIIVHPPQETTDVIAFGYDQAFETETIHPDGKVRFQLGTVPADENGDIRVAYDAALFPAATTITNKAMKDEIISAEQDLYDQILAKAERQETLSSVAVFIIPILTILLLVLVVRVVMKARMKKLDVERELQKSFYVPKETLSIPATICFIKGIVPTETMAAALLDLVRKGYVTQTEGSTFKLTNKPSKMLEHEQILLSFLFDEVGSEEQFSFEDLNSYTKINENHQTYQTNMMKWQEAVRNEVKRNGLYEKIPKLRWTLVIISVILLPFLILFPMYDLLGWFFATLVLLIAYFIFAVSYWPKTFDGLIITHEWRSLKERLSELSTKEWESLTNDEQMRAYIYGIGINDKDIIKKNEVLIQNFAPPLHSRANTYDYGSSTVNINTLILIGPLASTSFHSAQTTTESTTNSSSNSTGGGVGGGGGGSGAF